MCAPRSEGSLALNLEHLLHPEQPKQGQENYVVRGFNGFTQAERCPRQSLCSCPVRSVWSTCLVLDNSFLVLTPSCVVQNSPSERSLCPLVWAGHAWVWDRAPAWAPHSPDCPGFKGALKPDLPSKDLELTQLLPQEQCSRAGCEQAWSGFFASSLQGWLLLRWGFGPEVTASAPGDG